MTWLAIWSFLKSTAGKVLIGVLTILSLGGYLYLKGQASGRRKERESQRAEADRIEQKDKDLVKDLRNDSYDDAIDRL